MRIYFLLVISTEGLEAKRYLGNPKGLFVAMDSSSFSAVGLHTSVLSQKPGDLTACQTVRRVFKCNFAFHGLEFGTSIVGNRRTTPKISGSLGVVLNQFAKNSYLEKLV